MKLSRARPACTARVFILPGALAVLGFAHGHSLVAKAQIIDTSGQSYYEDARPLVDHPLPDLLRAVPELQGLEPAENQDELAFILDKTGKATEDLLGSMPNLISREDVTQAKLGDQGSVKEPRRREFDYLIVVHRQDANITVEESRPGLEGTRLDAQDLEEGYMLTRGFASVWMHFLPSNRPASCFRYLGRQTDGGLRCYVVAFAQIPGWATVTGKFVYEGRSVLILYQGIAWIDRASFRIARLRMDMLAPRPDIGLERQTTELHFGETRLPQRSPLWLPQKVVVTTGMNEQLYQNVHRYSDYRLFKVETKILSAPPDQPLRDRPN
jgi:hypothetical protein